MLTIGFLQKCAECALLASCSPGNINLLARFKSIAHTLAALQNRDTKILLQWAYNCGKSIKFRDTQPMFFSSPSSFPSWGSLRERHSGTTSWKPMSINKRLQITSRLESRSFLSQVEILALLQHCPINFKQSRTKWSLLINSPIIFNNYNFFIKS